MVRKTALATMALVLSFALMVSCATASPSANQAVTEGLTSQSVNPPATDSQKGLSAGNINNEQFPSIDYFIPDYQGLVQSGNSFEIGVIWSDDIQWLSLSQTDFEDARTQIREWINNDVEIIRETTGNQDFEPTISLCQFDLNGDGIDEYIAFLGGSSLWGGARSSGAFIVFFLDDGEIVKEVNLPTGIYVDVSSLETSHTIGILKRSEGMDDFIILQRLFTWNGKNWS